MSACDNPRELSRKYGDKKKLHISFPAKLVTATDDRLPAYVSYSAGQDLFKVIEDQVQIIYS